MAGLGDLDENVFQAGSCPLGPPNGLFYNGIAFFLEQLQELGLFLAEGFDLGNFTVEAIDYRLLFGQWWQGDSQVAEGGRTQFKLIGATLGVDLFQLALHVVLFEKVVEVSRVNFLGVGAENGYMAVSQVEFRRLELRTSSNHAPAGTANENVTRLDYSLRSANRLIGVVFESR